MKGRRQFIRFD